MAPAELTKPVTPMSPSFNTSVHLIPSPEGKRPENYRPLIFRWYVWGYHSCIMIVLAIAIEVATFFSNKNSGFHVNPHNVFSFKGHVSAQFLLSFFPTLLIGPIPFLYDSIWFWFRVYQPYITLARGDAGAVDSVNQNYLAPNKIVAILTARKHGHRLLYLTGLLSLATLMFQPLASSFFELKNINYTTAIKGQKTDQILGIPDNAKDLTPWVAAAGYVAASVAQPLGDPPFVNGNWTTATFTPPEVDPTTVPTMDVTTTGVQTLPRCQLAASVNISQVGSNISFIATAPASFGTAGTGLCSSSFPFPANSSTQQYGSQAISGCTVNTTAAETISSFQPVLLWFFNADSENGTGAAVFCAPTLSVSNVRAQFTVSDRALTSVNITGGYTVDNNVTGGTNQGRAFNGLIFDTTGSDQFVKARANTVSSVLPGAILKFASLQTGGLPNAFQNPSVFLDYTNVLYQRHLAIGAQGAYFLPDDSLLDADQTALIPRLFISPPIAHVLAALLFVTGVMSIWLHVQHRRARANLSLTHTPGSIASTVALTGRSGFGDLLVPYETDASLAAKLGPLRFRLDERTGAILADSDDAYAPGKRGSRVPIGKLPASPLAKMHFQRQADDLQMRLLGPEADPTSPAPTSTLVDRSSKVSFAHGTRGGPDPDKDHPPALRAGAGAGAGAGPGGLLDVPYAWEPLPELSKDGQVRHDDRTP